jgi:hypothetical protein
MELRVGFRPSQGQIDHCIRAHILDAGAPQLVRLLRLAAAEEDEMDSDYCWQESVTEDHLHLFRSAQARTTVCS